jgi:beta-lactamase regulating signal transducer with metallopeptidase domain
MESYFPFLVVAWFAGAFLMGFRLMGSWIYLNNLGKKGIQTPTDEWNLLFRDLCTKMGIQRPVQFFISDRVQEPITLRHLKPIVLFPIGLVTQLSMEQVEVVLLHELAHIKRWDYLVNWVQSLLELLFFYHPAVWWLSGQVRSAREHCCDDLVLQAGQQRRMLYAQTLTQVSAYSLNSKSKLAMSLNGNNNNSFTFRVKRLFGQVDQRFDWQKSMISGMLVLFVVLVAMFNTSSVFADENKEPINTELWDLIHDEISQLELEDEFVLESIPLEEKTVFATDQPAALVEASIELFGIKPMLAVQDTLPLYMVDGKKVAQKVLAKIKQAPEKIASVSVLKGKSAIEAYGEEARYGAVLITTKNKVEKAENIKKPAVVITGEASEAANNEHPLIVLDGVKRGFGKEKMDDLDPNDIATVNVMKGEAATTAYGKDAKNGVIEIRTKAAAEKAKTLEQALNNVRSVEQVKVVEGNPLIIIDGVPVKDKNATIDNLNLDPKDIISVDVLKNKSAIEIYGPAAKAGAVIIKTKNPKKAKDGYETTIKIRPGTESQGDPLYVLNGKVLDTEKDPLKEIKPDEIATINILKGEAAIKKYQEQAANGVVEIYTKDFKGEMPHAVTGVATKKVVVPAIDIKRGKDLGKTRFFYGEHKDAIMKTMDPLVVMDGKVLGRKSKVAKSLKGKELGNIIYGGPLQKDLDKYGSIAEDGVTHISLKETNIKAGKISVNGKTDKNGLDKYMTYIDGKKVGYFKEVKETLDKTKLKAFTVYDEKSAPAAYESAKDGVILIETKFAQAEQVVTGSITKAQNIPAGNTALKIDFKGKVTVQDEGLGEEDFEVDKMTLELKDLKEADTKKDSKPLRFSSEGGIDIKAYLHEDARHPLMILDGKSMPASDPRIQNLDPATVKSIELIESGKALIPYGAAAKYGVLKINTNGRLVGVLGKKAKEEPGIVNGMEIDVEFKDAQFWTGPKGNTKLVDPLVVVNGIPKGLQSEVGRSIQNKDLLTVTFSGPTSELLAKYGVRSKNGVVHIHTKAAAIEGKLASVSPFQKEIEATLKVFPNPFGKNIRISFNLPEAARTKVSVFNIQGQLVKVLDDAQLQAGPHQLDWNSERSPVGTYTVLIESANSRITKTIVKK